MPKDYSSSDIDAKLQELKNFQKCQNCGTFTTDEECPSDCEGCSPGDLRGEISDRNKELLTEFVSYLRADSDVSCQRQYKYLYLFKTLLTSNNKTDEPFITFNLDEAAKDDMRKAVGKIQSSSYSEWTVHDLKVAIKKFYRTLHEEETERPKRVKKILNAQFMKGSKNIDNQRETEALEPEEVMDMVEEADTTRDKLIVLFFFETGARIGEIEEATLGDIDLKQKYADVELITLKNDKGPRTLTLTRCVGLLQQWLEEHPRHDEEDAPLFVTTAGSNGSPRGTQLSQEYMAKILRGLAKEADVGKRVTPHIMRHSAATHYGMEWSITRMMYWFGWKESNMAETYCHENEDRMKKARLAEEGINQEENGADATGMKECGRCGETWPPTQQYCGHCSLALDHDAAKDAKELKESVETASGVDVDKQQLKEELATLKEQIESLE